jgi:hypothetical protein
MLRKRLVFPAAMVAILAIFIPIANARFKQTGATAPGTSKLWIEATIHDFGTVEAGTPVRYSFKIRNDGAAALEIRSVVPSCGCTTTDYDKVIAPGGEGKITLAVEHTGGYAGEAQKFATVTTNDPLQPRIQLTLHFFFKGSPKPPNLGAATMTPTGAKKMGPFVVSPGDKWTTAVVRGGSVPGTLQILNQGTQLAHITGVNPGGTDFSVTLRTVEDGKNYALSIATNPQLKAGHYTQTVRLVTDSKEAPEIPIDLDVTVYPFVVAAPTAIHLSSVALDSVSRTVIPVIYVQKVRGEGLLIKSISSDLPFLQIDPKTEIEGKRIVIHMTFDTSKIPTAGKFTGKIHVVTNDEEVPSLDVSIDGTFY